VRLLRLLVVVGFGVALTGCYAQARWGPGHTGFNPLESTLTPANVSSVILHWHYPCGSCDPTAAPAVYAGVVYVPQSVTLATPPHPPGLVAFNASSGSLLWTASLDSGAATPAVGSPFTGGNGLVFVTDTNADGVGQLIALHTSNGAPAWSVTLAGNAPSAPTLAAGAAGTPEAGGVLFVTLTDTHKVEAVSTAGVEVFTTPAGQFSTSVAVGNHIAYIGGTDGRLYAIDTLSGAPTWDAAAAAAPSKGITGSPAVSGTTVYAATLDGVVSAFDASSGAPTWTNTTISGSVNESLAVADGSVFVSEEQGAAPFGPGFVYALSAATGMVQWHDNSELTFYGSAPTIANGVVYVYDSFGFLDGFNTTTGSVVLHLAVTLSTGEPVVAGGQIFNTSTGMDVYGL
jgi:outer membrane protein assembly factor BamB